MLKAVDVMTHRVRTIRTDTSVLDALRVMVDENLSGLPVVDADDRLAGIVTEGDFLRRTELGTEPHRPRWLEFLIGPGKLANDYVDTHGRKVGEVMSHPVCSVREHTPLDEIVRLMEQRRIKRVPVVRGERVVGIVSRADLLRAFIRAATEAGADTSATTDAAIGARITTEMERQHWAPRSTISVSVCGGVVTLYGVITDNRARTALRVLAENTPGVVKVRDYLTTIEPMTGYVVQGSPDMQ